MVWGRQIDGSRRLALAEIPAEEWHGAKFTYGFLLEQNGQLPDVTIFPPSGEATVVRQYADLHVSKIQGRTIKWTSRAPSSGRGERV